MVRVLKFLNRLIHSHIYHVPTVCQAVFLGVSWGKRGPGNVVRILAGDENIWLLAPDSCLRETVLSAGEVEIMQTQAFLGEITC